MASPARRVLGEKDANALLQAPSPRKVNPGLENASPMAQRPSLKRSISPISPRAGQKRKIEEAYDQDVPESRDESMAHPMSQMTEILSDNPSEHEGIYKFSMDQYKSTPNTAFSSFRPSQDEPCQVEAQFEIHEEPSQQTLDTMHAITLPQNTSQPVPSLRPNLNHEGSQNSLSMSSLIDFENNRSSQDEDDNMQMMEEDEVVADQRPKTQEDSRKEMLLEKAETLRTRLQLAIFKIQTNQVSQPFARLQIPEARGSSPPEIPITTTSISSSSPSSSSTVKASDPDRSPAVALEARVATARARATMDPKPKVRSLSSLPMPNMVPTAFSARWNNAQLDTDEQPGSSQAQAAVIPSSPPLPLPLPPTGQLSSSDACHLGVGGGVKGRGTDLHGEPRTPVRLSSPITASVSAARHGHGHVHGDNYRANTSQRRSYYHRPGGLTSSVVKGEAANSLLELVRGGGGGGGGAARSGGVGMCGL